MNTKQIEYILTLARECSFSKAAEVLNISQPSLSQFIKKIENEIGFELFNRTGGELRLTDAGKIFVDAGRKILDIEHQMDNSLSDLALNKTGSLIIGVSPYRAVSMMPIIAASFQKLYPGMHLIVREGTTADLKEGMDNSEYDFAITLRPFNETIFNYEKVMEEELILAAPSNYSQIHPIVLSDHKYPVVDTKELDNLGFVMLTEAQFMQEQLKNLSIENNLDIKPAVVVKSLEAQIEMVKAGVGVALVPSGIKRFCNDSEVSFFTFEKPLPKREIVIMWRKDRPLSSIAEKLKNLICSIDW